jgi:glyoxylase-like metal-dependent hydrolase (beta-lactamase superfamily II)
MSSLRVLAGLLTAISWTIPAVAQSPAPADYDIVRLADGVYGVMWRATPISPEPNVLIVVNDDDVLVVDSSMFPSTARTIIAEIKKITPKPVRYLVNTHWHDDHVFGNAEFKDAWPGVLIIGHPNTRTDAQEQAFGAIPQDIENNKAALAKYEGILRAGKTDDGTPLTDERRARVHTVIGYYTRYAKEAPTVRTALPDVLVTRDLTIHSGGRTIAIRYLGRGNTRGDLVVHLPKERLVATGDLVVAPTPFGFGSYYADWAETLASMQQLDASTLFLAHGPVQHDWTYVATLRRVLTDLVTRVNEQVGKGATLEQVQKSVTLDDWKKTLAGDDDLEKRAFDAYFVQPAVERQYKLAKGETR